MKESMKRYIVSTKGNKQYLTVSGRLIWFREEHPDWSIETEPIHLDFEKGQAIFRATIKDDKGRIVAQATKNETRSDFPDYIEKAETGAIGRALALCGYGTQFAIEFDEGDRIVDSPIPTR